MAKCDEGYRCEVCGRDVEAITESDLYLRFVLGEVPLEMIHRLPERHILCNPGVGPVHRRPRLSAGVSATVPSARLHLDPAYVREEEDARHPRLAAVASDPDVGADDCGVPVERHAGQTGWLARRCADREQRAYGPIGIYRTWSLKSSSVPAPTKTSNSSIAWATEVDLANHDNTRHRQATSYAAICVADYRIGVMSDQHTTLTDAHSRTCSSRVCDNPQS